jgi:hypothetical protein
MKSSDMASIFLTSTTSLSPSNINKWELKTGLLGINASLLNLTNIKLKNNGVFLLYKATSIVFKCLFKALKYLMFSYRDAQIVKQELDTLIEVLIKTDTSLTLCILSKLSKLMTFLLVTARFEAVSQFSFNKKDCVL